MCYMHVLINVCVCVCLKFFDWFERFLFTFNNIKKDVLTSIWMLCCLFSTVHGSINRRISPPASEFDLEGVGIIDIALDKYSRKKNHAPVTDNQLITEAQQQTPEHIVQRIDSCSSQSSINSTTVPDLETTAGSYGAMLQSYAKRNKPVDLAAIETEGYDQCHHGNEPGTGDGYVVNDEDDDRHGNSCDLTLALSLNYEVCSADTITSTLYVCTVSCDPHMQM